MSSLTLAPYRRVLAHAPLRRVLLIGSLVRIPVFATGILVSIHVVTTLGRSYAEAGVLAAAATISIAASGPVRGRMLDRFGLRRVVAPTLVVSGVAWGIAPWVGYWWLFPLVVVAGLFVVPSFSGIRQAIIAAVPEDERRTAIALDSSILELLFMLAPALAIWAATAWGTPIVLFAVQMVGVVAGIGLWVANPPLRSAGEEASEEPEPVRRTWLRAPFIAVIAIAVVANLVLAGSDLSFVAEMRDFDQLALIGVVLAVWAFGSFVGGIAYGAFDRDVGSRWLLLGLALTTLPMAFASSVWQLTVLAFVAGLLCAPTLTATIHEVSKLVPSRARGEALGWHGAAVTGGGALGAPVAGLAIDGYGPGAGFVAIAAVGALVALAAFVVGNRPSHRMAVAAGDGTRMPSDPARR